MRGEGMGLGLGLQAQSLDKAGEVGLAKAEEVPRRSLHKAPGPGTSEEDWVSKESKK